MIALTAIEVAAILTKLLPEVVKPLVHTISDSKLRPIEQEGDRLIMGMPSRERIEHLFEYALDSSVYSQLPIQ